MILALHDVYFKKNSFAAEIYMGRALYPPFSPLSLLLFPDRQRHDQSIASNSLMIPQNIPDYDKPEPLFTSLTDADSAVQVQGMMSYDIARKVR